MKTLRIDLADILDDIGAPSGSTATATVQYVDTNGVSRDLNLVDGTIVVSVPRQLPAFSGAGVVDVEVYETDDVLVREVDHGHLLKVKWVITTPDGAKYGNTGTRNSRRVAITSDLPDPVSLASLSTPTPVPPYTGGYVTPETYAALVARVVELEAAPGGGGSGGTLIADDTPAAPAEGESATYFVTSAVSWPVGLVWSTDPDGGVEPTITDAALVSMFTLDGTTYAVLGSTFPAPAVPDVTAPTTPTGLSAVAASHTTVNLSWTASTDAVGVTGYEYRVDGGTAVDAGAGVAETVGSLAAATEYDFEVRAYDAAGNFSGWSTVATETTDAAPDVTAPTTPTGLSATATGSTTVDLAWTASTDAVGVTGYEYRISAGSAVDAGAGVAESVTSLSPSTAYTFEVRAYDAAGNRSAWSTSAGATTDAAADSTPPTVGTLAGSAITSAGFTLTVSGAADETALHATPYRFSTDDGATYSAWQTSPVYVATGLAASTGYTCKHQTRDAAGNVSTGAGVLVTTTAAAALAVAYTGTGDDPANAATYTFTAMPIGAADPTRHVVVAIAVRTTSSLTFSSVTIGGVTATLDKVNNATGADNTAYTMTALARAAVPTGTTATVVATMSGAGLRAVSAAWALTGATPTVAGTAASSSPAATLTPTASTGPAVILASAAGSSDALTLGSVTTDITTVSSEGGTFRLSGGSSTASPASVTVTGTGSLNPQSIVVAYVGS